MNKKPFGSKPYKTLNAAIVTIYILFAMVYMFRENLYRVDNSYLTLFAGTAPNLIPSFLFTLIGIFYAVPFFKGNASINRSIFICLINAANMIVFILIEYLHVLFKAGVWDNYDILASLIGIMAATAIYFRIRRSFILEIK